MCMQFVSVNLKEVAFKCACNLSVIMLFLISYIGEHTNLDVFKKVVKQIKKQFSSYLNNCFIDL